MPIPERDPIQRMEALKKGNDIRVKRAVLKRDIKTGKVLVDLVLLDPPGYVETMQLFDLLLAAPLYGRTRVNKILRGCAIQPTKAIGDLSLRQRIELISILRG